MLVPTEPFVPLLERHVESTGEDLTNLARRAGIEENTLRRWRDRRVKTAEFGMADIVLCKMNMQTLWYVEPLKSIYYSVDLGYQQCEAMGCSIWFKPKVQRGPTKQRYCSHSCKLSAVNQRRGLAVRRFKPTGPDTCWRGHELTPENTKHRPDGKRQCRTCFNTAQRRRRAERKVAA